MATTRLFVKDLELNCIIGCSEHERHHPRQLLVDLAMDIADCTALHTDKLTDTVDYAVLADILIAKTAETRFFLIEKLAQFLSDLCLAFDQRIMRLELCLHKFDCIPHAKESSVLLVSTRS